MYLLFITYSARCGGWFREGESDDIGTRPLVPATEGYPRKEQKFVAKSSSGGLARQFSSKMNVFIFNICT